MELERLEVVEAPVAGHQAHLVERQPRLHADRERARDDLEVERAVVARGDLVEAVAAVAEHAREHVQAPGRALRVGLRADLRGQRQALDQGHQVGPVALQRGAVAQVDPFEGEVLDLLLDGRVAVGQEAAAQRPRVLPESQVDARRLHRGGGDLPRVGLPASRRASASRRQLGGEHPARVAAGERDLGGQAGHGALAHGRSLLGIGH